MKKNYILRTILTIIITAIITFSITYICIYAKKGGSNLQSGSAITSMYSDATNSKLKVIRDKINSEYVGNVDENALQEYAIKGYVAGLNDIYSEYFTKDEMTDFSNETIGTYVGIGVTMTKDSEKNQIVVYGVTPNSPAEEAGIKVNDVIIKVDGNDCTGDDFETIPNKILGQEGTKVSVTVLRDGKELTFDMKRRKIVNQTITSELLDDNIGYIYLSSFEDNTYEQFKSAYDDLISKGAKSLIVDLRNNGGGIVKEATDIGDLFTDKGKVLLIESDKDKKEIKTYSKQDKTINMNVVLLVNEYSASASEIFTGALKDSGKAKIVGTTTFGKGIVQSVIPLSDGTAIKLTIAKYFTPNGNDIHKIGIEPDYEVELADGRKNAVNLPHEEDAQLDKAIEIIKKEAK